MNDQAKKIQAMIDQIVSPDGECHWCPYSMAFFVYLPLTHLEVARKVKELFAPLTSDVDVGLDATDERIQVSAYL